MIDKYTIVMYKELKIYVPENTCNYCIYMWTNLIDNKKYIGKTSRGIYIRTKEHCTHSITNCNDYNSLLHKAIRENGLQNFKVEVLEFCKTQKELTELELKYIKQFDTFTPNGYNESCSDEIHSNFYWQQEARDKKSLEMKKYCISHPNFLKDLQTKRIGKRNSEKQNNKISVGNSKIKLFSKTDKIKFYNFCLKKINDLKSWSKISPLISKMYNISATPRDCRRKSRKTAHDLNKPYIETYENKINWQGVKNEVLELIKLLLSKNTAPEIQKIILKKYNVELKLGWIYNYHKQTKKQTLLN